MVNEELDRKLLQIIKEQQEPKHRMVDPDDPRCRRLLHTFKEGTTPPMDIFYILKGARDAEYWFMNGAFDKSNSIYFEPHIFSCENRKLKPRSGHSLDEVISVKKADLNHGNFALMVDDSWNSGSTTRKTVAYLEDVGYERERIFVFHYFGCGAQGGRFKSERFGFVFHNPVLLSATTMLDLFDHPEKYQ